MKYTHEHAIQQKYNLIRNKKTSETQTQLIKKNQEKPNENRIDHITFCSLCA